MWTFTTVVPNQYCYYFIKDTSWFPNVACVLKVCFIVVFHSVTKNIFLNGIYLRRMIHAILVFNGCMDRNLQTTMWNVDVKIHLLKFCCCKDSRPKNFWGLLLAAEVCHIFQGRSQIDSIQHDVV